MHPIRVLGALALLCVGLAAAAANPAFTTTGTNCSDITWQPDVIAQYPNVASACRAVVERNGKTYVEFNGIVERNAGSRGLYVRFEGSDRTILVKPDPDQRIQVGARSFRARDAVRGKDMKVYVPSDQFVASLGDEQAEVVETDIVEVLPTAEVAAVETSEIPSELPRTASPLPWLAIGGVALLLLAGALRLSRRVPRVE
jgi:hypothetical protein